MSSVDLRLCTKLAELIGRFEIARSIQTCRYNPFLAVATFAASHSRGSDIRWPLKSILVGYCLASFACSTGTMYEMWCNAHITASRYPTWLKHQLGLAKTNRYRKEILYASGLTDGDRPLTLNLYRSGAFHFAGCFHDTK
jgi:hypothetical protein